MTLNVFLCHSTEDKEVVRKLYKQLSAESFNPWLDEEDLLPGQSWEREIPKAVRDSDVVLVCLSKQSVSKSGYIQKEIRLALDVAEEQPEGTIYIVPVKLEDCEVPERLEGWQWVNLYEERGLERLLQSLRLRANTPGLHASITKSIATDISTVKVTGTIDLAIEMENYQTRILIKDQGVVLSEPSLIAINKLTNRVAAVGTDAEAYLTPGGDVVVHFPIKDNKIADNELAGRMLRHFISKACKGNRTTRKRAVVAIPSELTQIERRAFVNTAYRAKAAEVYLVERTLCAAIGAGLPIIGPHGNMILCVSESATEVMAISHGRPAASKSIRVGTNVMAEAITTYIERKYSLLIGERTAESVRDYLGSAFPLDEPLSMDVRGRNLIEGIPKTITITDEEVREALADSNATIVNVVLEVLNRTPPELSAEIIERGITLTGGGATLKNLDKRIRIETNLPVLVPEDPLTSVVRGAAIMLSNSNLPMEGRFVETPGLILNRIFNSTVGSILQLFSSDLAIDIGAKNTLIYAKGRGIVVSEPSIVAVNKDTYAVEAIGKEAREMLGRTPGSIISIHPLEKGVIGNVDVAVKMLRSFIRKAHNGKSWVMPRVAIPVRSGLSKVEREALEDATYRAWASEVYLVDEVICAAIGTGLPITEPHGNMIVDIGGGATDIAVISLSGVVYSRAVRVAGNEMDEAITQYIKRKYNLLIGERTAEAIKIQLGSAFPLDEELWMDVRGRNLIEGIPKTITINDEEVREALADSVMDMVIAVRVALQKIPPELSSDLFERGIVLTGGGAQLKNLDKRISIETGLPVSIADDPLSSVLLGAGKMLSDFDLLKRLKFG